jgi:chemosensory pili system protein ChpA (sensor histidine kinase/response regulator)
MVSRAGSPTSPRTRTAPGRRRPSVPAPTPCAPKGVTVPLVLAAKADAAASPAPAVEQPVAAAETFSVPEFDLDAGAPEAAGTAVAEAPAALTDLDFDLVFENVDATAQTRPAEAVSEPAAEIAGIDFDSLAGLSASTEITVAPVAAGDPGPSLDMDAGEAIELTDADFDKHFQAEAIEPAEPAKADFAADFTFDASPASAEPAPVQHLETIEALDALDTVEASDSMLSADGSGDEQVKVIGALRIGIPLYNVYLNEADEWSRRLVTEVAEWSLERNQPVSDSTVALAHSLAGSSATVGFDALSEMARALEHALQQSRAHHSNGAVKYGQVFVDAAEDIRRLLHQFAAGFLKEPDASVLDRLKQLDFSDSVLPPGTDLSDFDFAPGFR